MESGHHKKIYKVKDNCRACPQPRWIQNYCNGDKGSGQDMSHNNNPTSNCDTFSLSSNMPSHHTPVLTQAEHPLR